MTFFSLLKYTLKFVLVFILNKNMIPYQDNLKHQLVLSKNQHTFSSQVQSGTGLLHLTKTERCCYSQKFCKEVKVNLISYIFFYHLNNDIVKCILLAPEIKHKMKLFSLCLHQYRISSSSFPILVVFLVEEFGAHQFVAIMLCDGRSQSYSSTTEMILLNLPSSISKFHKLFNNVRFSIFEFNFKGL